MIKVQQSLSGCLQNAAGDSSFITIYRDPYESHSSYIHCIPLLKVRGS